MTVLPQLSGYLTAVGYREGQDVQKGQFLAQIDPRQYEISKQQAEAQLAKDKASLAQARSDLARFTQLNERKSIAEQTYVDQKFLVQQDEAAIKADEAKSRNSTSTSPTAASPRRCRAGSGCASSIRATT